MVDFIDNKPNPNRRQFLRLAGVTSASAIVATVVARGSSSSVPSPSASHIEDLPSREKSTAVELINVQYQDTEAQFTVPTLKINARAIGLIGEQPLPNPNLDLWVLSDNRRIAGLTITNIHQIIRLLGSDKSSLITPKSQEQLSPSDIIIPISDRVDHKRWLTNLGLIVVTPENEKDCFQDDAVATLVINSATTRRLSEDGQRVVSDDERVDTYEVRDVGAFIHKGQPISPVSPEPSQPPKPDIPSPDNLPPIYFNPPQSV
jgi:hypothetical protein